MSQASFSDFKEQVRGATDIVDIVSQFTQLKVNGKNLKGLCPLPGHIEKTASFNVNGAMQFYYCFGCQKGGDIFTFAQEVMGYSFKESLEYFARKAGLNPPTYYSADKHLSSSDSTSSQKKADLFKINLTAKNIFKNVLETCKKDHPARVYLEKRGLTSKTIKDFELGYAPDGWSFLSQKLIKEKELLCQLGLIIKKQASSSSQNHSPETRYYDVYRNRIMFPIITIKDEVAGFGGRCLIKSDREGKYINSSNSPIFHKSQVLYGLKMAATHIRSLDQVIVVEGYMDVLTLHQNGFKNTVGVLGTALTVDHANLLKKYTKNIILLFDSDVAGQKASEKTLPIVLEAGLYPRSVDLPEGQDPDSIIKEWGKAKFQEKLNKATDLFESILSRYTKGQLLSPSMKLQILDNMGAFVTPIQDKRLKTLYIQSLAEHLRLTPERIRQYLLPQKSSQNRFVRDLKGGVAFQKKNNWQTQKKQIFKKQIEKSISKAELIVAAIVANYPQYLKMLEGEHVLDMFSSEKIIGFLKKIQGLSRQKPIKQDTVRVDILVQNDNLSSFENQGLDAQLIESIMFISNEKDLSLIDQLFEDGLIRIKEHFLKEQARTAVDRVSSNVNISDLKHFMEIQKRKHRLEVSRHQREIL